MVVVGATVVDDVEVGVEDDVVVLVGLVVVVVDVGVTVVELLDVGLVVVELLEVGVVVVELLEVGVEVLKLVLSLGALKDPLGVSVLDEFMLGWITVKNKTTKIAANTSKTIAAIAAIISGFFVNQ